MALISRLDLLRLLERAMRRADLPVSFSAGFHPLPRLQVALALTLGVEADGEWMDIDFRQVVDPDQTRMALQAQLSPGLKLEEACRVPVTGAGLSQLLRTARWRWTQLAPGPIAVPRWDAAIDALMEAHTLVWSDTDKKGRSRCRDGRPLLRHLRRCSNARGGNASRLPSNPLEPMTVTLDLEAEIDGQGRSLRPVQISHWLSGVLSAPLEVTGMRRCGLELAPGGARTQGCNGSSASV